MTNVSRNFLITLALSAVAVAQGASKSDTTAAQTQSVPAKQSSQKDAAAKNSGTHSNNMIGNHKDVMTADADKTQGASSASGNSVSNHKDVMTAAAGNNQGASSRQGNTVGNHKDVMISVPIDPKARTKPDSTPPAPPATNATPGPGKAAKSDPNSPH